MKTFVSYQQIVFRLLFSFVSFFSCVLIGANQQATDVGLYGNWVKKHEWQKLSEKLLVEMDGIYAELEKNDVEQFQPQYAEADRQFNDFYKKIGVSKAAVAGLLQEVKQDLVEKLEKSRQANEDVNDRRLDAEQKAFQLEQDIKKVEFDIKQLEVDMQLVEQFDEQINARQAYVQELLAMGQRKRTEGIQAFEELKMLLDDRKARERYYFIKGCVDNLNQLRSFFVNTFLAETKDVIQKSLQHMQQVEASIRQLEEQGAVINNRSVVLEELKVRQAEEKLRALEREEEERRMLEKNKPKRTARAVSFFESFSQTVSLVWYVIVESFMDLYTTVRNVIFGAPYEPVEKEQRHKQNMHAPDLLEQDEDSETVDAVASIQKQPITQQQAASVAPLIEPIPDEIVPDLDADFTAPSV